MRSRITSSAGLPNTKDLPRSPAERALEEDAVLLQHRLVRPKRRSAARALLASGRPPG